MPLDMMVMQVWNIGLGLTEWKTALKNVWNWCEFNLFLI
jgi:hypothetical protein